MIPRSGRHHSGGTAPGAPAVPTSPANTPTSITVAWAPPTSGTLDNGTYTLQQALHGGAFSTIATVPYCTDGSGSITDAFNNVWAINPGVAAGGGITVNGVYDSPTNNVSLMCLVSGTIWQYGSGAWYPLTPAAYYGSTPPSWSGSTGTSTSPLSITSSGLTTGQEYDYQVAVSNSSGQGPFSPILTVTPAASGPFAKPLMAYLGDGVYPAMANFAAKWQVPDMAIGYWYGAGSWSSLWGSYQPHYPNVIPALGMPMGPQTYPESFDISGLLAGNYDSAINSCFSTTSPLFPWIVIRPGWEWNLTSGIPDSQIVSGFQHIATLAHNYSNSNYPNFKVYVHWCPNADHMPNDSSLTNFLSNNYPGDSYVDIIGLDHYGPPFGPASDANNTGAPSVLSIANFAISRGKLFALGETSSQPGDTTWPNQLASTLSGISGLKIAYVGLYDASNTAFSSNATGLAAYKSMWSTVSALA